MVADTYVERAAVVALMRSGAYGAGLSERLERQGSALELFLEVGGVDSAMPRLFNDEGPNMQTLLDTAMDDVTGWADAGMHQLTVLDESYPLNLRLVHDRPPLIFVAGELEAGDERSVAVIGSRRASAAGTQTAGWVAEHLARDDYTVVSGLAEGIDRAAHDAALDCGGRTIAVIGTGLRRCYPRAHWRLQQRIASEAAVVSQFWPDDPPARHTFPARNAVMSGLSLATVIVEAGPHSGARVQARRAHGHGRPVFLFEPVLANEWARELTKRPGTHVVNRPEEITERLERLASPELVG